MVTLATLEGIRALKDALTEGEALDAGDVDLAEVLHGGGGHRHYVCHRCRRAGFKNREGRSLCLSCPSDCLSSREYLAALVEREVRVYYQEPASAIRP